MDVEKISQIAKLIRRAARAHHSFQQEEFGGIRNEDWAIWYSKFILENGLEDLHPNPPEANVLADLLTQLDQEYKAMETEQKWPDFYAEKIFHA